MGRRTQAASTLGYDLRGGRLSICLVPLFFLPQEDSSSASFLIDRRGKEIRSAFLLLL